MDSYLILATPNDTPFIISFLSKMRDELGELDTTDAVMSEAVQRSFSEQVKWFLFKDETGAYFGTCYLQSVHSYWSAQKRYYLGGFYILPEYRGQGRFGDLNKQLKNWVEQNNGIQIFAHIHKDNEKSKESFESVEFEPTDYIYYARYWGE